MATDLDPSIGDLLSPNSSHGSPLFDFLTAFAPRKLKDLFRLCEYLYFNSAQVYAVLQKFATYPITEITYTTTNEALRKKYEHLHTKIFKTRRALTRAAIDKYVYGNSFLSIYTPFVRFLKCPRCQQLANVNNVEYKFNLKKMTFTFDCPNDKCKAIKVKGEVVDKKLFRPDKMTLIRWDPKLMDIDYNQITGHSEYFYTIPKELKERISKGNKHLIGTMPMSFLETLSKDQTYKFAEGQLFHIKMDAPAGLEAQWGFPPLASTIKLFFYAAVLKKANECVALDAPIETTAGLVCADDVKVGDAVRTHTGAWQPVVDKWYRDARPDEIGHKITLSGLRPFPVTYSPKHPIMTVRRTDEHRRSDTRDMQPSYTVLSNPHLYEEALAPAGFLTVGDYVLYPRRLPTEEQTIDVAAYSGLRNTGDYVYSEETEMGTIEAFEALERGETIPYSMGKKIAGRMIRADHTPKRLPSIRPLTEDLAYILGWYAGDGSCNKRSVFFSLGMDDDHEPLVAAIKREFGLEAGNNTSKRGNLRTININHIIVRNLIKGLIPGTSREKKVPHQILDAPDAVKLAFLRGYHEADGHEDPAYDAFATGSAELAYGVYRLLLHFGCIATVASHVTQDSKLKDGRTIRGGNVHYQTRTHSTSRDRLHALWVGETPPEVTIGKSGYFWKDYFASRISKVEEKKESQYIDFKVATDETFCTAGTVCHNCIALDYIVPFRIISPKQANNSGDPVVSISLQRWSSTMKLNIKKWRRDPLHIMWSPIPCEITYMGGQARALMVLGEVQAAEDSIIGAMGLPKEFFAGGFSAMGSGIQLRILENQLIHQTCDITDMLQWITDQVGKRLGWASIECGLTPFKLIDDVEQKRTLLSLNQVSPDGRPWISKATIGEAFDIDPSKEREQLKQEALDGIRHEQEVQIETMKLQNTLAQQVRAQQQMGSGSLQYDQQAVIAQADQIVAQLLPMDVGSRRSQLHGLEIEDYVMYSVVNNRLRDQLGQQNAQIRAQNQQDSAAAPGTEPMGAPTGAAPGPGPGIGGAPQG